MGWAGHRGKTLSWHEEKQRRCGSRDVARDLGISISTASAALQNREDISESTRQRVQWVADELGYQPDSIVRSLVARRSEYFGSGRARSVAIFLSELLKGVDSIASEQEYSLLVCNTGEDAEKEDGILSMLESRRVDGLSDCFARNARTRNWKQAIEGLDRSVVFVDRRLAWTFTLLEVTTKRLVFGRPRILAEHGYRRIAHITASRTVSTAIGRRRGYLKALRQLSIVPAPELMMEVNYHEESEGLRSHAEVAGSAETSGRRFCGE